MHFPQLPDPDGWDVHFTTAPHILADDFLCTQTGPITDIHFWYSWESDIKDAFTKIHASIHEDLPVGNPDNPHPYSIPGDLKWEKDFNPAVDNVSTRLYGTGPQGFLTPEEGYTPDNHQEIWQANLYIDEPEAFVQQAGTIYWLDLYIELPIGTQSLAGWKTADLDRYPGQQYVGQHYLDDAVYLHDKGSIIEWRELNDPLDQHSLDLAFVITPEPTSMLLVLAGIIGLLKRRR